MASNRLNNLQLFVIKNVVLSFIILCEINIFIILVINFYVFDFDAFYKSFFDNCL